MKVALVCLVLALFAAGAMADSVELLYAKGVAINYGQQDCNCHYGCAAIKGDVKVTSCAGLAKHVFSHQTNLSVANFPWYDLPATYAQTFAANYFPNTAGQCVELWTFQSENICMGPYPSSAPSYEFCLKMTYTGSSTVVWSGTGSTNYKVGAYGEFCAQPAYVFGAKKTAVESFEGHRFLNKTTRFVLSSTFTISKVVVDSAVRDVQISYATSHDAYSTWTTVALSASTTYSTFTEYSQIDLPVSLYTTGLRFKVLGTYNSAQIVDDNYGAAQAYSYVFDDYYM